MRREIILIFAMATALQGCITYASVQDEVPYKTEIASGEADDLSGCVLDKLRRAHDLLYQFSASKVGQNYEIIPEIVDGGGYAPWAVEFRPSGEHKTIIGVKSKMTILGTPNHPDDVWQIIKSCEPPSLGSATNSAK